MALQKNYSHVSPLLIRNVNYFGRKGGFQAILQRIKRLDKKIGILPLKLYINIFFLVCIPFSFLIVCWLPFHILINVHPLLLYSSLFIYLCPILHIAKRYPHNTSPRVIHSRSPKNRIWLPPQFNRSRTASIGEEWLWGDRTLLPNHIGKGSLPR